MLSETVIYRHSVEELSGASWHGNENFIIIIFRNRRPAMESQASVPLMGDR